MTTSNGSSGVRGRVVLITGAARGIGADAARRLAQRGAHVALVDRDADVLARTAAALGPDVAAFVADVRDAGAVEGAVAATVDRFGGIDAVVANAGISGPPATVAAMAPADFEAVIDINLLGVYRTVRAALPHVVERRGYVLPIASVAAVVPVPLQSAYAASKAGVEAFSRSLRMEIAHTGTRVGVGYFGFIDTDMVRNALAERAVQHALKGIPGILRRPLPVGAAGAAVARGVERRAARVYAPRWVPLLLASRATVGFGSAVATRDPHLAQACEMCVVDEQRTEGKRSGVAA